jgi:hypothetical protein
MITNKSRATLNRLRNNTKQAQQIMMIAIKIRMTLFLRKSSFGPSGILGIFDSRGHHVFPLSVRHRIWLSRKGVTYGRHDKS